MSSKSSSIFDQSSFHSVPNCFFPASLNFSRADFSDARFLSAAFPVARLHKTSAAYLPPGIAYKPALEISNPVFAPASVNLVPYCKGLPTVYFSVDATTSSILFGINNACLVVSLATSFAPSATCFANVCGAFSTASRTPFFAKPFATAAIPPVAATSAANAAPATGNPINPLLVTSIPAIGTVSVNHGLT